MAKKPVPPVLKPEWSYLVEIDKLAGEPKGFVIEASDAERADLARRMGLVSLDAFAAQVTLQQVRGGIIQALGTLKADVVQSCVVSLAPVASHLEVDFEGWFGDSESALSFARAKNEREAKKGHAEVEILEESEDPEPIVNGKVDIAELASQHLSLNLDPYPHAEGVEHELTTDTASQEVGGSARKSPFEALKDWKEKR